MKEYEKKREREKEIYRSYRMRNYRIYWCMVLVFQASKVRLDIVNSVRHILKHCMTKHSLDQTQSYFLFFQKGNFYTSEKKKPFLIFCYLFYLQKKKSTYTEKQATIKLIGRQLNFLPLLRLHTRLFFSFYFQEKERGKKKN